VAYCLLIGIALLLRVVFLGDGLVVDELRRPTSERVLEKMKQLSARSRIAAGAEA